MNTIIKPKRESDMEVNVLPDGFAVVYNSRTNLACTLTPLAAFVWEFCDGSNTPVEIVEHLESIEELPKNPALKQEIDLLLKDFLESGLVYIDED
jgi:hypothetical protein